MSTVVNLYGWTTPAAYDPFVDHTWVTTYDVIGSHYESIKRVVSAGQYFWYCWGGFLSSASTSIGSGSGTLEKATCVCAPNVTQGDNCHGTIYYYGIDGVCHQVANQLLAVTGNSALNVAGVRGGNVSCWLYGLYGLNRGDWSNSAHGCGVHPGADVETIIFPIRDGRLAQDTLDELSSIRDSFRTQVQTLRPAVDARSIDTGALAVHINALINAHLKRAADTLGPKAYQGAFGVPAYQPITLVDSSALSVSSDGTQ